MDSNPPSAAVELVIKTFTSVTSPPTTLITPPLPERRAAVELRMELSASHMLPSATCSAPPSKAVESTMELPFLTATWPNTTYMAPPL
eukprot:4547870-Prymnesium_polylepis.1